jgi:hypothetical protein
LTIEPLAHRSAREVCRATGISMRKYRKLAALNDKPDEG